MVRLYTINPDSFASIEQESQAYCLGFLLADGWVMTGNRGISLAVHDRDVSVLDYIQKTCGSNAPRYIKTRKTGFKGDTLTMIHLCSKKMTRDLASLGLIPNKSASTFLPELKPDLMRHLLRGLFDGDGSIGQRQFWLSGSHTILSDVIRVSRHTGATFSISICNSWPRLAGSRKDANFLHWLYMDCGFALPRKLATYRTSW